MRYVIPNTIAIAMLLVACQTEEPVTDEMSTTFEQGPMSLLPENDLLATDSDAPAPTYQLTSEE